jgi:hypothetical protein
LTSTNKRRHFSAPAHEAGGLYPYYIGAKTLLPAGELLKTRALALVRAWQFLCLSRVRIQKIGILSKKSAPALRASGAPPNSSHGEMHFFVFNGLGHGQLCTVTWMRAIFAQFHSSCTLAV